MSGPWALFFFVACVMIWAEATFIYRMAYCGSVAFVGALVFAHQFGVELFKAVTR